MASNFEFDTRELLGLVTSIRDGLLNRRVFHERWIIALQAWVWRNWPSGPPLTPLTLIARKGQAPLLDKGTMRQTVGGVTPNLLKPSPLSYNEAFPDHGMFGSKLIQAALLNFGGTVKPVRAKNLAIPLTAEAKKTGSPRNFPRALFFVPARGGVLGTSASTSGFLAEDRGRTKKDGSKGKQQLRMQYILKRSVVIPSRKFMPTIDEAVTVGSQVADQYLSDLAIGEIGQGGRSNG